MIALDNVKMSFDGVKVLDIEKLEFDDDTSYFIKGESGTGKTTLFNIISGLKVPDEGSVFINDEYLQLKSEKERDVFRAENVGYIFQDFNLFDGFSALENVMIPLAFVGERVSTKEGKARALDVLERVGLKEKANVKINKLSGGEKQRVAIARAIVNMPKVLLADEPTGNLDRNNSRKIMSLLCDLQKENHATLLVISHDLSLGDMFDKQMDIYDFNAREVEQ